MAKFNGLFGKMRGKYGGGVFAVIKGQNILREYNPQPENPRSYAQQAQRALLANMTKFYKRGTQNYYKFAFEDRTARESDYNAFARNNMQQGVFFTRELYDNPACPALGNYTLTRGSITHDVQLGIIGDNIAFLHVFSSNIATIGEFSAWLVSSQPSLQAGDIFTLVIAESDLQPGNILRGTTPPGWVTIQFYIDPSSTETLASVGLTCVEDGAVGSGYRIYCEMNAVDRASFAALTFSRNTSSGLKVSNTGMVVSPAGLVLIDWNQGEYAKLQAAISWGGNPEAFLQGGQLSTLPELTSVTVANVQNAPYAYGMGKFGAVGQDVRIAVSLAGSGLKTTAQGGKYTFMLYDATLYNVDEDFNEPVQPRIVCELEGTGTATAISASGTVVSEKAIGSSSFQGYGLLMVDDVPVWWGFMQYQAG